MRMPRPGGGRGRGADKGPGPTPSGPGKPDWQRLRRHFLPFIRPHAVAIGIGTLCAISSLLMQKSHPLITRFLVDKVLTPTLKTPWSPELYSESIRLFVLGVSAMIGIALLSAAISALRTRVIQRAGAAMVRELRIHVYRHIQSLSLKFFESRQTGEIMSRVSGDVNSLEHLVTHIGDQIFTEVLNLVVTLIIVFSLNPFLALIALIPVPFMILLMLVFSRRIRPIYRAIRDRLGALNAKLQDNISGIRVIKAFHTEAKEEERFNKENRDFFDMQMTGVRLWSVAFPMIGLVQASGGILVTAVGGYMLLQPEPRITLGDFFAFSAYVMQLYQPIGHLFHMFNMLLQSFAAGERVAEVLEAEPEVADKTDAPGLPPVRGEVRFEDVSFGYEAGTPVLKNLNVTAKPGEIVALVGRSGTGKTSFVNLIPRFYDPTEGRILVDGHDLKSVTQASLRSQIAIVLQDPFLFNGTLMENIRYARPDATDDEVRRAAEAANATEFIDTLAKAYETEIGERGVKLSGGQKQRVSIARAILADRRILILDEATSMVDSHSEYLIQKALARLMEGRTTFVIAHRLSTIRNADKILVLAEGTIAESGRHDELMARGGIYAEMYRAQFRLEEEGEAKVRGFPGMGMPMAPPSLFPN